MRSGCPSASSPQELVSSPVAAAARSGVSSAVSSGSSAIGESDRWRSLAGALVDQHLLNQDGVGLGGGDHQIDPAQDLHAQLIGALAAGEILRAQLAQEGLKH